MNLYQHFRAEEIETVKQLEQLVERAETTYAPVLTPFLDPRQQFILTTLVNRSEDCNVAFNGGFMGCERSRALIYPSYYEVQDNDFELTLLEIKYAEKFVTLTHRNILGALMSLGFKREFLGDIMIGNRIQFVIAHHLKDFCIQNLTKLKGSSVKLLEIEHIEASNQEAFQTHQSTVSSLRLDNIISEMTRKSRTIAQKLIEKEHVKVNHVVITKTSFSVEVNDLISIKGYGRGKIDVIGDRTKKDKIRITYGTLFKSKR